MFVYKEQVEPYLHYWEDYKKPKFIMNKIEEICDNIAKKGERNQYSEVFDLLYEFIDDNLDKFLPEADHDE